MNNQQRNAVLITGAGGGIGKALCENFVEAGYFVVATDRPGISTSHEPLLPLDLEHFCNSQSTRKEFVSQAHKLLQGSRLCAIINNAAVQLLGAVTEISSDTFQSTMSVNVLAPLLLVQSFHDLLSEAGGSVINIGSVHAGKTKPGFVSYATSKSALLGLTRAMAVDLGKSGIRCNIIQPGAISTPMLEEGFIERQEARRQLDSFQPVGRIGRPQEIAELALFLCSPRAEFITGAEFAIDGGIGARLHDPD